MNRNILLYSEGDFQLYLDFFKFIGISLIALIILIIIFMRWIKKEYHKREK